MRAPYHPFKGIETLIPLFPTKNQPGIKGIELQLAGIMVKITPQGQNVVPNESSLDTQRCPGFRV